ncbi:MAG: PEP-CTERM sorting domain-containing protein [Acidobacteria bacterium]|nr:PEP-CTERM sorting domain-containing protein [Acidobacteriota bacterium]
MPSGAGSSVPEPSTALLVRGGVAAVLYWRMRRPIRRITR